MEQQPHRQGEEEPKRYDHAGAEQAANVVPKVYVASQADLDLGRLHGSWIDAAQPPDDIRDAINGVLLASPLGVHAGDRWTIHDSVGFNGLHVGGQEDLGYLSRVATGIAEHGLAFAHWTQLAASDNELDRFEQAYLGRWPSQTAYAADQLDQLGLYELATRNVPDELRSYITLASDRYGNDLVRSGEIATAPSEDGGVYVFRTQ